MRGRRDWTVLVTVVALAATSFVPAARADDEFFAGLSKLATREVRKQLRDKRLKFAAGPLDGHVQAVEPERYLTAEVVDFELNNDLLEARVVARGRFRVEGKTDAKADVNVLADVKLDAMVEVRFSKEGERYFVEPRILDLSLGLSIVEILPADLAGSEELLSNLAMTAFEKYKAEIIADTNKRLGKRPF